MLAQRGVSGWQTRSRLPGLPDFVFEQSRVVLFVDGCFWHHCPTCCRMPSTNASYWQAKIKANARRDRVVDATLTGLGWSVVRVWEHELKRNRKVVIRRILEVL